MKQFLLVFFSCLSLGLWAQPNFGIQQKDSCYKKLDDRRKNRFAEWECGKIAGVVDCNEKLEMDPNSGIVITSGNKKPYSGQCETCHMNGVLERRVRFVNGKTEGVDTTYYKNGCIMAIRSHVQGVENGKWSYFADSCQIPIWEKNYSVGQLNGPQLTYSVRKVGAKWKVDTVKFENYINGVLNGKKFSYTNGKRTKEVNYVNGVLDGPFLLYNLDGVVIEESNYKQGKKHGVFKYFYDDGVLLKTEIWDMGCKNGEFKTFFYEQDLQSIENYKKAKGKPAVYVSADIYECFNEKDAKAIYELLKGKTPEMRKKVFDDYVNRGAATYYEERQIEQNQRDFLGSKKFGDSIHSPYKYKERFYVVNMYKHETLTKSEYKNGWFEERYPNKKLKRRALYERDMLIEEHVYTENGTETKTVGASKTSNKEDDAMPTSTDGKKKKEKKKKKKKGSESGSTEGK